LFIVNVILNIGDIIIRLMNIITTSIVISMIGILAIGGLNTNLVFGQSDPRQGYGGGSGTGGGAPGVSSPPYSGGGGGGGHIIGDESSPSIGGGGFGSGPDNPKFVKPCGSGGYGGPSLGDNPRGGGSCEYAPQ
jgi:hypothetical protein